MRKPKMPRKPKQPKAGASAQTWKNYSVRLDEWKKRCTEKMKPYLEWKKVKAAAQKKARSLR